MAAQTSARKESENAARERRCLVSGEIRPREELIRFVLSPESAVVPDLAGSLPGRGLWVTATREAIEVAAAKNLFAKAAGENAKASPGLADDVARLLRERCLQLLGLAKSAGITVLGQTQVEAASRASQLALILIADDAASDAAKIRVSAPVIRLFTRSEMGAALGHDQLVYAGLRPHGLTEKLQNEISRLAKTAARAHISEESERK